MNIHSRDDYIIDQYQTVPILVSDTKQQTKITTSKETTFKQVYNAKSKNAIARNFLYNGNVSKQWQSDNMKEQKGKDKRNSR